MKKCYAKLISSSSFRGDLTNEPKCLFAYFANISQGERSIESPDIINPKTALTYSAELEKVKSSVSMETSLLCLVFSIYTAICSFQQYLG